MNTNESIYQQVSNRTSDYVCWDCGLPFLTDEQKKREGVVTAHTAVCGLCGKEKGVTHIRHWNWLQIQKTGCIYLSITGHGMPPVSLFTENPFTESE